MRQGQYLFSVGHPNAVQALLDNGADVNARANDGKTTLEGARDANVRALLKHAGAKP